MNSRALLKQTNSKLGLRVRLWKDTIGPQLSPSLSILNSKAVLTQAEWVKRVALRFNAAPQVFHIQVSDYGAYSRLASDCGVGSSTVTVEDITGFELGHQIILRGLSGYDNFTIIGISGSVITMSGTTVNSYTALNATAEDDRWWTVATGRTAATATWITFGEPTDDHPMIAAYGRYWRVGSGYPDGVYKNNLDDFELYPDTYFDLSAYLEGSVDIAASADFETGQSPLGTASVRLMNTDDRFNRRNTSSPYIQSGVNYLQLPRRMTVEWIAYGADWQVAQSGGADDWQLLISYTVRQWNLQPGIHSYAIAVGETLHRLSYPVDIPLVEVKSTREILSDWVMMEGHREALAEGDGDAVKHRIAVVESTHIDRTHTSYREIVGRGTFGNAITLYYDPAEEEYLLYAGFYGIVTDGNYLYTAHSMEQPGEDQERGMVVVKRFMSGVPVGEDDVYYFYESDVTDIEAGDLCIVGSQLWVHTAQQNVTNNVFKYDVSNWKTRTYTASYAAKGGAGHKPVHACTDGTYLYVLYDGGSEGRILYKCNTSDYSTVWSHTFSSGDNTIIGQGVSGLVLIGSANLLIFTKSTVGDSNDYKVIRFTLSDTPAYATYAATINMLTRINPSVSLNNAYGWASIVQTGTGLLALTGSALGDRFHGATEYSHLWQSRSAAISRVGKVRFYAQNGNIVNADDDYNDPLAKKDAANYELEQIYVDNELQDNTGTYSGTIKTTDDYEINLLTGEILFITPPTYGSLLRMSYDYIPSVQYFTSDGVKRWESARRLAEASGLIVFTTPQERVAYKPRRHQEDLVFTSASAEVRQLKGRNIIHTGNSAYLFNTLQLANSEHNYFYTEGTDYTVGYDGATGKYTVTEVGTALTGHVIVTYLSGPTDDSLVLLDGDATENPAHIVNESESWNFAEVVNKVVVEGQRSFPLDTPISIAETSVVQPYALNVDTPFSKVQKAQSNAQYDWDGDQKIFSTEEDKNVAEAGFIVQFQDPMIIGTSRWILREPNVNHVEEDSKSNLADETAFVKVTWSVSFLESGSAEGTINYDVMLTNPLYWRVCVLDDEDDPAFPSAPEKFKTGSYVYIKKFRGAGVAASENVTIYAYKTQDTQFYIDKAGLIKEAAITDAENPTLSASPDKAIHVRVEPVDARGVHLFRQAGTYDGVTISADYCLRVGAVRYTYDGLIADVYNYSSVEQFLQVFVTGYPISAIEKIQVNCEDRITLDGSLSSMEQMGERTYRMGNEFVQSPGIARTVGFSALDWLKYVHSRVEATAKFNDDLAILDPCLVQCEDYHFDKDTSLWLVYGVRYSLVKGQSGMSKVTYLLIDMVESPSLPAPAS